MEKILAKLVSLILWSLFLPSTFAGEPNFGERVDRGLIEHPNLDEASGIAASRKNPGVLWAHNDSGDPNRVFALTTSGKHLGIFIIAGAAARDWEDIAIGPGPDEGESYLYIGDFGDNEGHFNLKYIYRVAEPELAVNGAARDSILAGAETITFRYPDGNRDAEALMVDPLTKDIYIITKRGSNSRVYRAAYPQSTDTTMTLEHVTDLSFSLTVAADISSNGLEILVKTYTNIYYWSRTASQTLKDILKQPAVNLPYVPEPQGEAVCWQADAMGYYTVSEELAGVPAHLYSYPRVGVTRVGQTPFQSPAFKLEQNYPNPFNPSTVIRYSISHAGSVKLNIYDALGRQVDSLFDHFQPPGDYRLEYQPHALESGAYFCRLQVGTSFGDFSQVRRLIYVK